ncbi:DUF433 domain-containing protein [Nocardia sp. NPDC060249]|uniref:DUF433 domain-containing protein n=1 Tax=Nocardia sp. NPDC060249 TaxID=3347082 RepID=UPI00364DD9D2
MNGIFQPCSRRARTSPSTPAVRGGEPMIEGTRVPSADVAALVRDGVPLTRSVITTLQSAPKPRAMPQTSRNTSTATTIVLRGRLLRETAPRRKCATVNQGGLVGLGTAIATVCAGLPHAIAALEASSGQRLISLSGIDPTRGVRIQVLDPARFGHPIGQT